MSVLTTGEDTVLKIGLPVIFVDMSNTVMVGKNAVYVGHERKVVCRKGNSKNEGESNKLEI